MAPNIYVKQYQGFGDNPYMFAGKAYLATLPPKKNSLVILSRPIQRMSCLLVYSINLDMGGNGIGLMNWLNEISSSSAQLQLRNSEYGHHSQASPSLVCSGPHSVDLFLLRKRGCGDPRSLIHQSLLQPHQISQNFLDARSCIGICYPRADPMLVSGLWKCPAH